MNIEYGKEPELFAFVVKQLAVLYAEVFAAPPWNEVWRCSLCDRFYGSDYLQEALRPCCKTQLTEAYPEKQTIDYISTEFSQPLAQKRLFYSKERLVGFSWGYQVKDARALAEKKWPQSENVQKEVVNAIAFHSNPEQSLYYLSEVGVSPLFRGRGIGTELTKSLLGYGVSLKKPVIFRTNWNSPMMIIAKRLRMRQIMGPKVTIVDREILESREDADFIDEINPERTLFIKLP